MMFQNCNYLRTVAGPKFMKAVNFLKEKYANGLQSVTDLYKAAKDWLWDNFNIFSDGEWLQLCDSMISSLVINNMIVFYEYQTVR